MSVLTGSRRPGLSAHPFQLVLELGNHVIQATTMVQILQGVDLLRQDRRFFHHDGHAGAADAISRFACIGLDGTFKQFHGLGAFIEDAPGIITVCSQHGCPGFGI